MADYLEHYGIRGQKWGIKHGPPYPLKSDVSRLVRRSRDNTDKAKEFNDYRDTDKTSKLIRDQLKVKELFQILKNFLEKNRLLNH